MTDKLPDLTKLDDDELDKLESSLAKERTAVRENQNAVADEKSFRIALKGLSPDQRAKFAIRVGHSVGSKGESKAEKTN
jgi:hypothetical protein